MSKKTVGIVLLVSVSFFNSCQYEDTSPSKGYVAFTLSADNIIGMQSASVAASAVVDIKDQQGKTVAEKQKIALSASGPGYATDNFPLPTGNFTLTSFVLLNAADEIIYAAPMANASKANSLRDPLPIAFSVSKEKLTQVAPEVVSVASQDTPDSFGYATFGFKQSDPQIINLKVSVKLQVGEFLYENIQTTIQVRGFDANNNLKWNDTISFVGPNDNLLPILSGYDHYTVSMEKWGATDSQTITATELSNARADGPTPVTYGLAGKAPYLRKPIFTYQYWSGPNGVNFQSRTEYSYDNTGKVHRINFYENYTTDSAAAVPTRYQTFEYLSSGSVSKLTNYWANNTKMSEDNYEYGVDGSLLRITEANYSAAVNSIMNLSVDASTQKVKASYAYSNGRGFDYEFSYIYKNLVSDKTTEGTDLCNNGSYSYDRNINPFKHLGYVSYLLADNYSINNRLTENVDYVSCAFPSLVPISYSYKYDDLGYPTEKITHYKGTTQFSATKYYYQTFPQ